MALTYGFYDAVLQGGEYDRVYTAEQFSKIFDGLVNDGIYEAIGDKFMVTPDSSTNMRIIIGSGRAWFEHTWSYNDSATLISLSAPDASRPRIDLIALEIDSTARENRFKIVNGTPKANNPVKPTVPEHCYPLAYVTVTGGASHKITAANIENAVGTSACPYVTGIIQVTSVDQLIAQWQALWNSWMTDTQSDTQDLLDNLEIEISQIDAGSDFDLPPIVGYDVSLLPSQWTTYTPASNTEEFKIYDKGYTYRALIPLTGVLSGMRPYVTWSLPTLDDAGAEVLNQCQCVTNGVYVYSAEKPSTTVTALTVECRRGSVVQG